MSLKALQSGGNIKEKTTKPFGIPFIKSGILKPTNFEDTKTINDMATIINKGFQYLLKDKGFDFFIRDGCILYFLGDF